MIQIELTLQQAQQLAQLVEIAMKATNVPNMRVGLPLYDLIEANVTEQIENQINPPVVAPPLPWLPPVVPSAKVAAP